MLLLHVSPQFLTFPEGLPAAGYFTGIRSLVRVTAHMHSQMVFLVKRLETQTAVMHPRTLQKQQHNEFFAEW